MQCAKKLLLCIFLIVSSLQLLQCLSKGDKCYHEVKKVTGICKIIKECESDIAELKKGIRPQNCGFKGKLPIVCCVIPVTTITTTTTTTSTTTTTTTKAEKPTETTQKPAVGVRSLQKCEEYKQYAFERELSPLLMRGATQLSNKCVFDKIKLIIGGDPAKAKEFPHMALIGYDNGNGKIWGCGGSLISENYILTAAHCLFSSNNGPATVVRLGDLNVTDPSDDENVQQIGIKELIAHPNYRQPLLYADIALLLLETPAKLGIFVRPACLYTESDTNTESAIATGWGLTDFGSERSDVLMKVVIKFFTASRCNISHSHDTIKLRSGIDDATQLCAGSDEEEKDTCQGDSGGPFQIYSDTYCMYDIIGVTSSGQSCGNIGIPAVYTRLYPYLQWIEDTVWPWLN